MPTTPPSLLLGLFVERSMVREDAPHRAEIIAYAIQKRECELTTLREIRRLLGFHPLRAAKIALLSGLIVGVLAFLIAQVGVLGRWYASLSATHVTIPVPLFGSKDIALGAYLTTSTALTWVTHIPVYGLQESVALAMAVVAVFLLEKAVSLLFRRQENQALLQRKSELEAEIAELRRWREADAQLTTPTTST